MRVSSRSNTRVFGRCKPVFLVADVGGVEARAVSPARKGEVESGLVDDSSDDGGGFKSRYITPGSVLLRERLGRLDTGSGNGGGIGGG